jgi:hypothetical protein
VNVKIDGIRRQYQPSGVESLGTTCFAKAASCDTMPLAVSPPAKDIDSH